MSLTDFGTAMFLPFRPESIEVLSEVPADLVCWTTFSATFCPFPTAFSVAALVAVAAFFEVDLAFDAAFFAALAALPVVFFTVFLGGRSGFRSGQHLRRNASRKPCVFQITKARFCQLGDRSQFCCFQFFCCCCTNAG